MKKSPILLILIGTSFMLLGCTDMDYYEPVPPVTVVHNPPSHSSAHYGAPTTPSSSGAYYGQPAPTAPIPPVTVEPNGNSDAHYGS